MTDERMRDIICNGDVDYWKLLMCEVSELIEDTAYMFKNPEYFSENERYSLLDKFRTMCKLVSEDSRSTGTLIKQLDLD